MYEDMADAFALMMNPPDNKYQVLLGSDEWIGEKGDLTLGRACDPGKGLPFPAMP